MVAVTPPKSRPTTTDRVITLLQKTNKPRSKKGIDVEALKGIGVGLTTDIPGGIVDLASMLGGPPVPDATSLNPYERFLADTGEKPVYTDALKKLQESIGSDALAQKVYGISDETLSDPVFQQGRLAAIPAGGVAGLAATSARLAKNLKKIADRVAEGVETTLGFTSADRGLQAQGLLTDASDDAAQANELASAAIADAEIRTTSDPEVTDVIEQDGVFIPEGGIAQTQPGQQALVPVGTPGQLALREDANPMFERKENITDIIDVPKAQELVYASQDQNFGSIVSYSPIRKQLYLSKNKTERKSGAEFIALLDQVPDSEKDFVMSGLRDYLLSNKNRLFTNAELLDIHNKYVPELRVKTVIGPYNMVPHSDSQQMIDVTSGGQVEYEGQLDNRGVMLFTNPKGFGGAFGDVPLAGRRSHDYYNLGKISHDSRFVGSGALASEAPKYTVPTGYLGHSRFDIIQDPRYPVESGRSIMLNVETQFPLAGGYDGYRSGKPLHDPGEQGGKTTTVKKLEDGRKIMSISMMEALDKINENMTEPLKKNMDAVAFMNSAKKRKLRDYALGFTNATKHKHVDAEDFSFDENGDFLFSTVQNNYRRRDLNFEDYKKSAFKRIGQANQELNALQNETNVLKNVLERVGDTAFNDYLRLLQNGEEQAAGDKLKQIFMMYRDELKIPSDNLNTTDPLLQKDEFIEKIANLTNKYNLLPNAESLDVDKIKEILRSRMFELNNEIKQARISDLLTDEVMRKLNTENQTYGDVSISELISFLPTVRPESATDIASVPGRIEFSHIILQNLDDDTIKKIVDEKLLLPEGAVDESSYTFEISARGPQQERVPKKINLKDIQNVDGFKKMIDDAVEGQKFSGLWSDAIDENLYSKKVIPYNHMISNFSNLEDLNRIKAYQKHIYNVLEDKQVEIDFDRYNQSIEKAKESLDDETKKAVEDIINLQNADELDVLQGDFTYSSPFGERKGAQQAYEYFPKVFMKEAYKKGMGGVIFPDRKIQQAVHSLDQNAAKNIYGDSTNPRNPKGIHKGLELIKKEFSNFEYEIIDNNHRLGKIGGKPMSGFFVDFEKNSDFFANNFGEDKLIRRAKGGLIHLGIGEMAREML